jgi:hypothetical protein
MPQSSAARVDINPSSRLTAFPSNEQRDELKLVADRLLAASNDPRLTADDRDVFKRVADEMLRQCGEQKIAPGSFSTTSLLALASSSPCM